MAKLVNYMEIMTRQFLEHWLKVSHEDICKCEDCKTDILAYALNHLPPKYITTDTGTLYMQKEQISIESQKQIQEKVKEALEHVSTFPHRRMNQERQFKALLEKICRERGLDFRQYRETHLKRRITARMRRHRIVSFEDYRNLLTREPQEYEGLFETLTINVSGFFRDPDVFKKLQDSVLTILIKDRIRRNLFSLRVWSAGCAGGEEPYSVAILLKEHPLVKKENLKIQIYATDIDRACLKKAEVAQYQPQALKNVDAALREKYFDFLDERLRLKEEVKELVKFQYHNLVTDNPLGKIDLVFCRNVVIYFSRQLQEKIFLNFYSSLNPGGFLVIGKVETLFGRARDLFRPFSIPERIFQK